MKSYDKASWHIDGGENEVEVIDRFNDVFAFLAEKNMLNEEGLETYEYGMDSSVSINSNMVNEQGESFLDTYYDAVLGQNPKEIKKSLEEAYKVYTKES